MYHNKIYNKSHKLSPSILLPIILILFNPPWVILVSSTNSFDLQDEVDLLEIETTTTNSNIVLDLEFKAQREDDAELNNSPPPTIRASYVESGVVKEILSEIPGDRVILPVTKYGLHVGQDVPKRSLRFDCNASYPVEWVYTGFGAPFQVISKSFRKIQNFTDPSTYSFSAYLDLTQSDERNGGKYSCKGISRNATLMDGTYFDLYVPGENLFLYVKSVKMELKKNDTKFMIPCPISNPRLSSFIKLYRQIRVKTKPSRFTSTFSYDPKVGFTVPIDSTQPLSNYRGKYFCKEPMTRRRSEIHTVLPPMEEYVQISPKTKFVSIKPGQKQIFVCAAKENITLTFSGDRQPRIIDFDMNPKFEFPFLATFEVTPTNQTSTEHTVINCVTSHDEILHTWEYSTYEDVSLQKFYFDSQKRYQDARYVCCSNSYYKPKLEYIFCRSETECGFKKRILDQDSEIKDVLLGDHRERISYLNNSCALFHPYLKYTLPSGILRCSVTGVNTEVKRDFMYYFNPYRIYQAYTDDKFDTAKVHSSDSIMKLSKTPSKNTLVGEKQRFLCYFSELFLSNGIIWRVEYLNGTSQLLDSTNDNMHSNTSFSQIELTFNDTNVIGIHCYAPVKDSRSAWRNVTGSIFVREPPKIRASIQTETGEVLKEIFINSTMGLLLDKSSLLNILNNSVHANTNLETFFVLDCNASFPVDFSYAGDGSPNLEYIANRVVNGSVLDANSYSYMAKLVFRSVNHQIVGRYSCISSTREFGHRNVPENLKANVNIFVPGEKLFVSSENQTYRAWEYRDSVLIPCPVTDPRPNITLLQYNNETKSFQPLNTTLPIDFDPLHGFSLSKNHTTSLFGLYKCVGDRNRSSGIIQVYQPSDAIRVNPYVKEMPILSNETQSFKCESKENVTIRFSDDPTNSLRKREILHEIDASSHYPYIASYRVQIGELANLTLINCTSVVEPNRTLHTWELYPGDGAFIDQLIYDNVTSEIKCCTPSHRIPSLEWVNCSSVTECTLKQSACLTQNKCQPGDYVLTEESDRSKMVNGCLTFDIRQRPGGLLKCVVKGVHKIVAQAMVYYYNEEKDYEVHDGYFLGTKMFDKFQVQNDKIMSLTSNMTDSSRNGSAIISNISKGDRVKFDCSGSKFFVSQTLKWALEANNGTMYYMDGKDISNYNQVHSQLEIEFETTHWKSIFCIAPNWKEYYGWRNLSMPLTFDNSTTTRDDDGNEGDSITISLR